MRLSSHIACGLGFWRSAPPQFPTFTRGIHHGPALRTAWFICPDYQKPSGGIRKIYRCVDIINDAGLNAAVVHSRSGFRCNWFANTTRIVSAREAWLGSHDVMVLPEIYDRPLHNLPPGVRQVIFNQNVYNTLNMIEKSPAHASLYTGNPNLVLVVVVSEDNEAVFASTFPKLPVQRLRLGIDPELYYSPSEPKPARIAYMPRKRVADATRVVEHLKRANALDGWEIIPIDGQSEARAAQLLRSSKLFLSFSKEEGFGLPPLEALACGCLVVGYHGSGGREYFRPPFATAIEDGDTTAFATTVQRILRSMHEDPMSTAALASAANRFVHNHYTLEEEQKSVISVFAPLLR